MALRYRDDQMPEVGSVAPVAAIGGIAAGLLVLAACATHPAPAPVVTHLQCLPMADYPADVQRAQAAALRALPAGSPLGRLVVDYGRLRAANRAACGTN